MHRLAVVVASLGLVLASGLGALVLTDRAVGWLVDPRFTPIAGAPDSDAALAREEFRVRVRTNGAGFRGPALPDGKAPHVYRIVVLGDSFTWGYGVRERQAYPARLERELNARLRARGSGRRVEVVNLGLPGAGPLDYLYHLRHTGLALAPDLVIVGLFANDVNDLYQIERFGTRSPLYTLAALRAGGLAPRPWWRRAAEEAAPNLYVMASRASRRLSPSPREANAAANAVAPAPPSGPPPEVVLAALGARYGQHDEVTARYHALAPADRAAVDRLLGGAPLGDDVRPAVLLSALIDPEAERDGILLRSPGRREALRDTARTLARLVRAARRSGAETALVVLPAAEQVDRSRWPTLAALGFRLDPAMLSDTALADDMRDLAGREDAHFVDLVALFRRRGAAGRYFVQDEHWNGRGQALAAAEIADALGFVVESR
jgi:lysophospholipase L1-like esterase